MKKTDSLEKEIRYLKTLNKSLTESCQELEKEVNTLRNQQDVIVGVSQTDYMQLQQKNERLKAENNILKQRTARQEKDIAYLKALSQAPAERPHNERGAGRKPSLTPEQIEEIRYRRQHGISYRALAKAYGCSVGTVYKACSKLIDEQEAKL